jgi:hypothetical protein
MNTINFVTFNNYSGSNTTLQHKSKYSAFATFKQITGAGYKLNKGSKGQTIFCGYRPVDKVNDKGHITTGNAPIFALVFDIADTTAMDDKKLIARLNKIVKG